MGSGAAFQQNTCQFLEKYVRGDTPFGMFGRGANVDPVAAAAWAQNFPEGSMRDSAVSQIARTWGNYAPDAAAEWIDTLPVGQVRDRAAGSFAGAIASNFPEQAIQWAQSMSDGKRSI